MARIVARQPNGLICQFSTVVDAIVAYNMTDEEYIQSYVEEAIERAQDEARRILQYRLTPFSRIEEYRDCLGEMSQEEFDHIVKEMYEPMKETSDE